MDCLASSCFGSCPEMYSAWPTDTPSPKDQQTEEQNADYPIVSGSSTATPGSAMPVLKRLADLWPNLVLTDLPGARTTPPERLYARQSWRSSTARSAIMIRPRRSRP